MVAETIAHELGHNMSLLHAPCNGPQQLDPNFPDRNGRIGSGGYNHFTGTVVHRRTPDVMSYCGPPNWISEYHFTRAFRHRLEKEAAVPALLPVRSTLLLWGGVDSTGVIPHLNPAFLVDAMPVFPYPGTEWKIAGWTDNGAEAFSHSFDMPETADAPGEQSTFVFTLPVTWLGNLDSISVTGPNGAVVVLDRTTNDPMTIVRDRISGHVRAILRQPVTQAMDAVGSGGSDFVALFSRGIPQ